MNILIVDSDPVAGQSWTVALTSAGHGARSVSGYGEAAALLKDEPFDLLVADISQMDDDGTAFLSSVKQNRPGTLVVLTTSKGSLESAVLGLRLGAFDYLVKPVRPEEMHSVAGRAQERVTDRDRKRQLIRVMEETLQQLKQMKAPASPGKPALKGSWIVAGPDLALDLERRVVIRQGQVINLTPTEFDVLAFLAGRPGKALSGEDILLAVKGFSPSVESARAATRVYVRRIRQKIEQNPDQPRYLMTVRGMGYVLREAG